jgi:hypothetical protein
VSLDLSHPAQWRDSWALALRWVIGLRLGLGALMAMAWWVVRPYLYLSPADWHRLWGSLPLYSDPIAEAVFGVWPRWDAIHYLNLAVRGYAGGAQEGDTVFYPMFVILTRLMTPFMAGDYVVGSLVVSTIAAVAALAGLHQLAARHYGLVSARWTVAVLALYPTAFFLMAPFTESLFLAFTLGAFLAAEDRRWLWAGGLGAAASLTRGPGMLTSLALAWLAWSQWHTPGLPAWKVTWPGSRTAFTIGMGLALPILGGLAFLYWRQAMGFAPFEEVWQTIGGSRWVNPIWNMVVSLQQFLSVHDIPTTLDTLSLVLFTGLTAILLVKRRWRRGEWVIYMGANWVLLLSKHNDLASSLQSLSRYVLVLFPGFIILGDWLAQRQPLFRFLYICLSAALLVVLSVLYTLWWFVG